MKAKVATLPGTPAVSVLLQECTEPLTVIVRPAGRTDQDHQVVPPKQDRMYHLRYRGRIIDAGGDYHRLKAKGDKFFKLGARQLVIETTEGYELCTWGLG